MKASVIVTTLNEESSITKLLVGLFSQTTLPDELIIIDAGSVDNTQQIIKDFKSKRKNTKHNRKTTSIAKLPITLLVKNNISRSKARNLGVQLAKNDTIAMTDAGCVPNKNWLANLTKPFTDKKYSKHKELVVAGFYTMLGTTNLQKAFSCYLGVFPKDFDNTFLPSTRSIAFTKGAWKKVGGFPINLTGAAEDTVFNYKLTKQGVKIVKKKDARVVWTMPKNLFEFVKKVSNYARGDIQSKIFFDKTKKLKSHNIKVIFVFVRYLLGLMLVLLAFFYTLLFPISIFIVFAYFVFAFLKVYKKTKRVGSAIWGPGVQITCDCAVMWGFVSGILKA